jgi:hypothetical protein
MNLAEAANALEGLLPVDGEQEDREETQLQSPMRMMARRAMRSCLRRCRRIQTMKLKRNSPKKMGESEEQEQPQVFTVKVDGKEVEVTLDELQKGYSRTQDYTRKTQQIAEIEETDRC